MRSAESQRHTKALRTADADIRAEFAGRSQQHQRKQIGRNDRRAPRALVGLGDEPP